MLRCDFGNAFVEGPLTSRVRSTTNAPGNAPSNKKVPSAKKAPSTKEAPASEGGIFGNMFGTLDGAHDYGLDGADDENTPILHNGYNGMQSTASRVRFKFPRRILDDTAVPTSYDRLPFGLDGQGYENPGVVVNQYGEPYDLRTAGRPVNAAQPMGAPYQQMPAYVPNPAAQAFMYQAPSPRVPPGPQMQQQAPFYAPVNQSQQPYTMPQVNPRPMPYPAQGPPGYDVPSHGFPAYINQMHGIPSTNPRVPMYQQTQPQLQPQAYQYPNPYPYPESAPQRLSIVDQQYQIFKHGARVTQMLSIDHRIVAAAVPHMLLLTQRPINKLRKDEMEAVKRALCGFISAGYFPNGERVEPIDGPSSSEHGSRKSKHESGSKAGSKAGEKAQNIAWKGNWQESQDTNAPTSDTSDPWANKDQQGDNISSQSVQHFSNGGKSQAGGAEDAAAEQNQPEQSGTRNDWGTGDSNDQNNDGGWTNGNAQQGNAAKTGAWDTGADNNAPAEQGGGWGGTPDEAASTKTASQRSTTSTATNPHAYVKPYFNAWRGTSQPSTGPRPLAHRPRHSPYTHPAPPTPHIPADQLGNRTHGVHAGRGADYVHKTLRPNYLDSMDSPFAVFVFKYRSAEKLEEILGKIVKPDLAKVADEVSRGVLMSMPKERLIEELVKNQKRMMESGGGGGGGADVETTGWGSGNAQGDTGAAQGGSQPQATKLEGFTPAAGGTKVPQQGNRDDTPTSGNGGGAAAGKPPSQSRGNNQKPAKGGWNQTGTGNTGPTGEPPVPKCGW